MDSTEKLFKELTEAAGVSGYEGEVRAIIRRHLEPMARIEHDKLGSIIGVKRGSADGPRVMLAGHMDEVGFMVSLITPEGFIRFVPLGGWWNQVMLGQRVVIKTSSGDVPGVLGAKPPHLMDAEEAKKMVDKKDMYIDIGATSADEVKACGVRLGDPVIPICPFTVLAPGKTYLAKAWDDRLGCALFIQTFQRLQSKDHPNTLYGVGTVQEEVGTRGAKTSVYNINPDVAIILEVDIAGDVPGIKPEESAVKLGQGPSLLLYDARMIPNLRLRDLVIATAEENKIPLQFSTMRGGATDGAMIHMHNEGVPTVVLGIPTRHIHSHAGIVHRADCDAALDLLVNLILRLDEATVTGLTAQ
jgi:putative aminopeptidase FrvX